MNYDEIIREQMKNYIDSDTTDTLSEYAGKLTNGISDDFTIEKILDATLHGESIFNNGQIISDLKDMFFYEAKGALAVASEIIAVCIVIGLLKNLSGSFGKTSVIKISNMVCVAVITGLALNNFYDIYSMTLETVKTLTYTMEILLPILIALIIAMGKVASGTIMNPLLLSSVTAFESVIKNCIIPMIFMSTVLTFLNCLTEKDYVNHLSKFIRKAALAITGFIIVIMSGIIAVQGLIVETADSILLETARYSLSNFIPIVGGFTSDTIGLFLKCMSSIKNVVGIFGIITISVMIMVPILKVFIIALIYIATGIFMEPVAGKKLAEGVIDIGSSLITMGAVMFFSSLLFILFFTCIMNLGG